MTNRSLYHRLLGGLALTLLTCLLISSALMFYWSFSDAHNLQDDLLVRLTEGDNRDRLSLDHDTNPTDHEWAEQQIYLRPASIATEPPLQHGFQTVIWQQQRYRAYSNGERVALQQTEPRNELAAERAWRSTIPLLLTAPFLLLTTYLILRSAFRPLEHFASELQQRHSDDLTPLDNAPLPREWQPLLNAFNDLLQRIDASRRQQQRFLANAAHELRTPLTALSLQTERLRSHDHSQQQQIDQLRHGIQRSAHLVSQLLDINRIESQPQTPSLTCDVHQTLLDTIAALYPLAEHKQHDISLDSIPPQYAAVPAQDLAIAISNLLANAIHYTPYGGQIHLATQSDGPYIHISIEDNGHGIPAAQRSEALEPFRRLSGAAESTQHGSGLGLAIVAAMANRYHGKLTLEDTQQHPHGLRVTLTLPKAG